ncbi:MAG: primosomal protein N' [Spirochaetia bacterium]|nr:primosomal protein N' [Spirochaetia bacterium]
MARYIDVIVNVPINQSFTYREPDNAQILPPEKTFGRRVEVRFGNRKLTGFVCAVYDDFPENCAVPEEKVRAAVRYIDEEQVLTPELYSIAKWMSRYYLSPIGDCVFAMIPSGRRETETPGFSFNEDESSFSKKVLSSEQEDAVNGILDSECNTLFHYLYGTTGSGKTEVFLAAAEKVMAQGKGVIYLVPEISLTPQVTQAVVNRFGNTAAVLHSALTPSQRLTEWKRILHRDARVVGGARSAVFAPVPDLGLIIIDEEHDSSYKSGSSPRYHARQIAMLRSSALKIPLVMGSATPSLEAWHSMECNVIKKHTLTKRLAGGKLPLIKSVNLSLEQNNGSSISKELEREIRRTLENRKQIILFLNRRGFTHFFRCNLCGFELKCRQCSVSLTYHKNENRLRCHYCGYNVQPPQQCPECGSLDVGYSGFGTEYIEAEVKAKFPNARVIRIDTDSLKKKGELQEKIESFKKGEYDILLGTQMVAKGLNFPNLQLVGVVLADTSLHLPDFRAGEKTFSLITQVAGRAGRFFPDGKVLVQSYSPDREPVARAVNNETELFYKNELETRKILNFPPFTRLLRLIFRSQVPGEAEKAAESAALILRENACADTAVLGPAECPLLMIGGNYRYQVLLRGKNAGSLQKTAGALIYGYTSPKNVYIEVDVDPVNLL